MKKYKADHYFRPAHGLDIRDQSGEVVINIKAPSSKEIEALAIKILCELNREYNTKMALMKDNDENYSMGYITPTERMEKEEQILNSVI